MFEGNRKSHLLMVFSLLLLTWGVAHGQTTSFSYQGRLTDGGNPATGNYDLQFALFDSLSGGTQIGTTQAVSAVPVSGGVFTTQLDFGVGAFSGANRFLEISVRPAGGGSFTTLAPRQQISSMPYAIRTLSAASADTATNATQLGGVAASQYVQTTDSRLADSRPPTPGSSNYIQNTISSQASSNFNISGNGTAAGTLSGNVVNAATQFNIGGNRVFSASATAAQATTSIGVGTPLANGPAFDSSFFGYQAGANTTYGYNSFFGSQAGQANQGGGDNSFFGAYAGLANTSGNDNTFVGYSTGTANQSGSGNTLIGSAAKLGSSNLTNATAIGTNAEVDTSNSMVLGSVGTNVGIGTTTPRARLDVVGGSAWTSAGWAGSVQLQNASAIGWTINSAGSHFGIGQTNGGLYFFRSLSPIGNNSFPAIYSLVIDDLGQVGINTIAPDMNLTVNGGADKPGGGSWATFSDERLKNIKGRFTPGLKAVMQLQPIRYQYKPDNALGIKSEGEHVGFGAQAVQKIIPEAVTKDDKGYLLVNNDPIMWTMLNAIKEQQSQIETLQKANAALNKRLQAVERTSRQKVGLGRGRR